MLVKKVQKKLGEYGITIYNDYKLENNEYIFITKNAVILVNKKDKSFGISFQVTTKAEEAATLTLIISEIDQPVYIMESFIFDQNHQFISGEEAYQLVQKANKESVKSQVNIEQTYKRYLDNVKGFEC